MPERIYQRERARAEAMGKALPRQADYWLGYRRGIGRAFSHANPGDRAAILADISIRAMRRGESVTR